MKLRQKRKCDCAGPYTRFSMQIWQNAKDIQEPFNFAEKH